MSSLKAYTERLADLVGSTPAIIYERQRALVRSRLLQQAKGRGPGSGVKVTETALATLLIASMATDNLFETGVRAREISNAKFGSETFYDALVRALGSQAEAAKVARIMISRTSQEASISYWKGKATQVHPFTGKAAQKSLVRIVAELDGQIIQQIAKDFANMSGMALAGRLTLHE